MPDLPSTVAGLMRFAAERYPDVAAVRSKEDGEWRERSYADVAADVERLALGLIDHGIEPGDRVCVLADTSPEWASPAFAIWSIGAIVVPIYPTNSPEECEWVAGNSGAVAAICGTADHLGKLRQVHERLPELRLADVFDGGEARRRDTAGRSARRGRGHGGARPAHRRRDARGPVPDHLHVGHHRAAEGLRPVEPQRRHGLRDRDRDGHDPAGDVAYLYLPLAHVFAQIVQLGVTVLGGTMAYFGGDTRQIIPELGEVKPDYIPSVPRIFEKL